MRWRSTRTACGFVHARSTPDVRPCREAGAGCPLICCRSGASSTDNSEAVDLSVDSSPVSRVRATDNSAMSADARLERWHRLRWWRTGVASTWPDDLPLPRLFEHVGAPADDP